MIRLASLAAVVVAALFAARAFAADGPRAVLTLAPSPTNTRNSEGDFLRLKDGRILFVYTHFTGGTNDEAEAHLAGRVSADGGLTWSDKDIPIPAVVGLTKNTMSVSLLRLANGEIALFCVTRNQPGDCRPHIQTSADEGQTWGPPRPCVPVEGCYNLNNARAIRTSKGRLILPVAYHGGGPGKTFVYRATAGSLLSDDSGQTWRRATTTLEPPKDSKSGLQEPGVIELKDGRLMMLMRTDQKCQMRSYSDDGGETWSAPELTDIASPLSPATVVRIPKTGDLLLVWNNNGGAPGSKYKAGRRTPFTVAISKDEGKTWIHHKDLETDPDGWFCYTAVLFVDDRVLLANCAGSKFGDLNTLKITSVPLDWIYGRAP
jgi:sialidase-1